MEKLSQIKKLDALLKLFKDDDVGIPFNELKNMMEGRNMPVSDFEIERYINQLLDDKYIMKGDGIYLIRIEGLLCNNYEQQIIIDAQNEKRITRNENLLIRGTWFAGVAAGFLFLWQVLIWFYPTHKDYQDRNLQKKSIEKSK